MLPARYLPPPALVILTTVTALLAQPTRAADQTETAAETVHMDAVNIETTRDKAFLLTLPKQSWDWRFGRMGDWKFLSSATDTKTENMLRDFAEFTSLKHWMIPQWKLPAGDRLRLVICGPRHTFEELRPAASEGNPRDAVTASRETPRPPLSSMPACSPCKSPRLTGSLAPVASARSDRTTDRTQTVARIRRSPKSP